MYHKEFTLPRSKSGISCACVLLQMCHSLGDMRNEWLPTKYEVVSWGSMHLGVSLFVM
jgi:hypothetical protein